MPCNKPWLSLIEMHDRNTIQRFHHSELTESQLDELAAIARAAFAEYAADGINMRDVTITADELRESLAKGGESVFIFLQKERPAGFCRGAVEQDGDLAFLRSEGIAVLPECRKRGIAASLIEHMEQWAVSCGAAYTRVDTACHAVGARAFHRRCGNRNWYYMHFPGRAYLSIVMRKDFSEPLPAFQRQLRLYFSWLQVHALFTSKGGERLWLRLKNKLLGKGFLGSFHRR